MEQALFKWRSTGIEGLQWGDVCPGETDPVIELILQRDAARFKEDGVRPHLSHPIHEAAMKGPLPRSLQVLRLDKCRIRTFPALPLGIHEFYAEACDFFTLPDFSAYTNLIVLSFPDNRIESICNPLPPTLASLNVEGNAVREVRSAKPNTLQNIAVQGNPKTGIRFLANWFQQRTAEFRTVHKPERTVYQDTQNVHASSIQSSTKMNLDIIASYKQSVLQKSRAELLASIRKEIGRLPSISSATLFSFSISNLFHSNINRFMHIIEDRIDTQYSMHGHTVFEIVERLWLRILDSPHRNDAMQRFVDEVKDGDGHCTNGFMVRMANVLVGLDDAFEMKLSPTEVLQARIPATIAREQKAGGEPVDVWMRILLQTWEDMCEVECKPSEAESWLTPLVDEMLDAGFVTRIADAPVSDCGGQDPPSLDAAPITPCRACVRCILTDMKPDIKPDLANLIATYSYRERKQNPPKTV